MLVKNSTCCDHVISIILKPFKLGLVFQMTFVMHVHDTRHEFVDALKANERCIWFRRLRNGHGKTVRMKLIQRLVR